jgi:hypothetical protein
MQLDEIVPWGRSLSEYRRMFDLSDDDMGARIIGCGDGPASFNAEMAALGHRVVSVDPLYAFSTEEIRQRIADTYGSVVEQTRAAAARFVWREFVDADALGQARLAAMEGFLQDYDAATVADRYVAGTLPALPFRGDSFDIALCSHLLFLYSEHLSLEFHVVSLREMTRVAADVRVFPLLDLDGNPSRHLDRVRSALVSDGYYVEVRRVPYEFQVDGNQMLRVTRG